MSERKKWRNLIARLPPEQQERIRQARDAFVREHATRRRPFSVRLTGETIDALRRIAAEHDRPVSWVIDHLIECYETEISVEASTPPPQPETER